MGVFAAAADDLDDSGLNGKALPELDADVFGDFLVRNLVGMQPREPLVCKAVTVKFSSNLLREDKALFAVRELLLTEDEALFIELLSSARNLAL